MCRRAAAVSTLIATQKMIAKTAVVVVMAKEFILIFISIATLGSGSFLRSLLLLNSGDQEEDNSLALALLVKTEATCPEDLIAQPLGILII